MKWQIGDPHNYAGHGDHAPTTGVVDRDGLLALKGHLAPQRQPTILGMESPHSTIPLGGLLPAGYRLRADHVSSAALKVAQRDLDVRILALEIQRCSDAIGLLSR